MSPSMRMDSRLRPVCTFEQPRLLKCTVHPSSHGDGVPIVSIEKTAVVKWACSSECRFTAGNSFHSSKCKSKLWVPLVNTDTCVHTFRYYVTSNG